MHAKVEVADRCYELRCGASLSLLTHSDADRVRTASLNISPFSASAGAFSSCQTAARCSKHETSLARAYGGVSCEKPRPGRWAFNDKQRSWAISRCIRQSLPSALLL